MLSRDELLKFMKWLRAERSWVVEPSFHLYDEKEFERQMLRIIDHYLKQVA